MHSDFLTVGEILHTTNKRNTQIAFKNDTVTFCSSHLYCRGTLSSCCISLQWGGSSHHLQALVNQKDYEISYNSDTYKTVSSDTLNNMQSAPSTQTVGSFGIGDGDVSENVTFKMN